MAGGERDGHLAVELAAGQVDRLLLPGLGQEHRGGEPPTLIDVPQHRGAELSSLGGGECTADGDGVLLVGR